MRDPQAEENMGGPPSAQLAERRGSPRLPFSVVVGITEQETGVRMEARVADIGRQGCYVDCMHVFRPGTPVGLKIQHRGREFEATATVVFSLIGVGMGLRFVNMTEPMETTLDKWLDEGGEAAGPEHSAEGSQEGRTNPQIERQVLRRLMELMIRKGLLNAHEGAELLHELQK